MDQTGFFLFRIFIFVNHKKENLLLAEEQQNIIRIKPFRFLTPTLGNNTTGSCGRRKQQLE